MQYKNSIKNNLTFCVTKYTLLLHGLGWLAERSNATVLKTADGATRPGVRIPHHPPPMENVPFGTFFIGIGMAIWD